MEAFFAFGAASNFYRFLILGVSIDIYLAVVSTALLAILAAFLLLLLASYLDKKRFIRSFQS